MTDPPAQLDTLLDELPGLSRARQLALITRAGPPDDVLGALGEEAERLAVTDAGRALAATECLVVLADELTSPVAQARVRRARAHALCNAGRLEEGWLVCNEAATLADEADAPVEAGRARLRSMQALGEMGRFDESVAAGQAALDAFVRAGEQELTARAEVNLGIVHQRRDEPARAVELFDRARPRLGDAPFALGTVDNNRGEALLALNDFAAAQAAFESALGHYERAGAAIVAGVAEGNLADLAARQGMLHRATLHFERARRRFESTHSQGHLDRLLAEQAEAMSVLGLPQEALQQFEAALPRLDRAAQALEAARARAGLGRTLIQLNRLSEAETALAAAARAFDQLGHNTARARVDLIRAELAATNGLPGEARRLVHAALALLHDRPVDAASARHLLARIGLLEGHFDEAEAEFNAALSVARRLDLAPLLADILHTGGRLRRRMGDLPTAVRNLQGAVEQIERVRGTLNAQRFRGAFLRDRLAAYDDLIVCLLDQGTTAASRRAFEVAEQARSRLLLEQVRGEVELEVGAADALSDPDERRLVTELSQVRAALDGLYSRLADDETGALDAAWQRSVIDLEQRLERLESRLSTTRGVAGLYAKTADVDAVTAALPADTTLIEYVSAGGKVAAFVVAAGRLTVYRGLASANEIDDRIARVQFQIDRALRPGAADGWRGEHLLADVRVELSRLDATLLAPLRESIPTDSRLLIVPHGAMHLLPFHALFDGTRYLIEQHDVHYALSAGLYTTARQHAGTSRNRPPLVVGVADAAAPLIEEEARRIGALLGEDTEVLLGASATAERVTATLPAAGLVHLACHARFAPATPLGSGVRLADRWLTVRDIYAMRLEAELVTLSGCETGRSLVRGGDELMGLLRGFFAAGAPTLLVSLWRVEDEITAEIMSAFYDGWQEESRDKRSKTAALRAAQCRALARHPHPAFWAHSDW